MADLKKKREKIVADMNKIQTQIQQMSDTIMFLRGQVNLLDELIVEDDKNDKNDKENKNVLINKEGDE